MATKQIYLNSDNHKFVSAQAERLNVSESKYINSLIEVQRNKTGSNVNLKTLEDKADKVINEPQQGEITSLKQAEKAFNDRLISYKELQQYKAVFSA